MPVDLSRECGRHTLDLAFEVELNENVWKGAR